MIEWLPICGNHEYRGNTGAVVDYTGVSRRWEMPAKYYSRTFDEDGVTVKVILLDTTPLIDKYRKDSETYPDAAKEDMQAQLTWLENELANAKEDWVVVAGHHPVYADTSKSDSERNDMQKRVDSILRKHNVDMYICGHIHNFQHIRQAGSKQHNPSYPKEVITNELKNIIIRSFYCNFVLNNKTINVMSEAEMNSYRLTSMEEPGDERMAQIMREVAEDARESSRRAAERVAAGIETATQAAQNKWADTINKIKNGSK